MYVRAGIFCVHVLGDKESDSRPSNAQSKTGVEQDKNGGRTGVARIVTRLVLSKEQAKQ